MVLGGIMNNYPLDIKMEKAKTELHIFLEKLRSEYRIPDFLMCYIMESENLSWKSKNISGIINKISDPEREEENGNKE